MCCVKNSAESVIFQETMHRFSFKSNFKSWAIWHSNLLYTLKSEPKLLNTSFIGTKTIIYGNFDGVAVMLPYSISSLSYQGQVPCVTSCIQVSADWWALIVFWICYEANILTLKTHYAPSNFWLLVSVVDRFSMMGQYCSIIWCKA